MKDKGTETIEFSGDKLKELAEYMDWNLPRFIKTIDKIGEHIAPIKYKEFTILK